MSDFRPSREALRTWLKVPGRTQAALGKAVGVKQQTISDLISERAPKPPSFDLAELIEIATGVLAAGWFSEEENARRLAAGARWAERVQNAAAARAVFDGARRGRRAARHIAA